MIVSALDPEYLKNPIVGVEVIGYRPCYIIGEIVYPGGSCPWEPGMRVIDVFNKCGTGSTYFTYRAVEDEFVIMRDGKAIRGGPEALVFPGDGIEVRERFF